MERQKNIWGKRGCELLNGGLCDACCELMAINFGFDTGPLKPINTPCEYQNRVTGCGQGCNLHTDGKPSPCKIYHCGNENPDTKFRLIAKAYSEGLVSWEEALASARKLKTGLGELDKVFVDIAESLKQTRGQPGHYVYLTGS